MKIGVIVGSIRKGRTAEKVAQWMKETIGEREGAEYEFIDLADFELPLYDGAGLPMLMNKQYDHDEVTRWSRTIDACDGFIFITPEYNHSVPAALKNAVDTLGPEWVDKPIAFVGYGGVGAIRAIEHWRQIAANFHMHDIREQLGFIQAMEMRDGFNPMPSRAKELASLCDRLEELTGKLRG